MFKSRHLSQIPQMIVLISLLLGMTACSLEVHQYEKYEIPDLLLRSHITPSKAEKIQLRSYLATKHAETAAGYYAKAYMAYENSNTDLEKKHFERMLKKFHDDANTVHYQSFMGDVASQLAATKKGIKLYPEFLNYNFVIRMTDIYIANKKTLDIDTLLQELKVMESSLGKDIYVFDYARGMLQKNVYKDTGKSLEFFESALDKKGGNKLFNLWRDYFNAAYADGVTGSNSDEFEDDIEMAIGSIDESTMSKLSKDIVSHKIYKFFAAKVKKKSLSSSTAYYKAANKRYFTFEVVDELRGNYIRQKKEKLLVSLLEEAVKKLPNNPDTLGLLAEEYAYIKEYEKAESLYKKAIKNSRVYIDKFHYAKKYSKNVLLATYRSAEAIEVLKAAAGSYKDKELDLYRALAEAYLFNLNYAEAKAYINKIKISRGKKFSSADKKLESVIDDYIERSKKGYFSSVNENNKTQSKEVPSVLATTSVNANWLIVNPDQRHFLATNGNGTYRLWDSKNFSVINEYAGAVLDKSYTKTMTKPVYSPDGRYIAYATEFNGDLGSVMLVYDLKDQRFSHQLPMSKKTSALAWSPDGSELAIWNYGRLIKYSLNDKRVIQQGEVKDQDGADLMKWTANGKYIALLERASTGSIRIFDADTMRQLHRLDQANWPHALGVSKDGRYIFSADNRRKLHRWDTDKNFEHKKISIPVLGRLIEPHPERKEIIINDWDGRNSLALVDYEKMEVIKEERTGKAELRMHFINKGKQILAANFKDDFYEVYDAKTLALVKKYKGESTVVTGGAFANKKRNKLIVWDQEGLHVWSVLTGKKLHSWEGKFQSVVSDPVNADKFYTLEKIEKAKLTQISAYDLKDFSKEDVGGPNFIVDEWGIDNNSMVLSGRHFKPMAKGSFLGVVMVIDLQEKEHQQVVVDMVTNSLEYRYLMKSRFKHLAISPDKKHIAIVTAWVDGWKRKEKTSKVTRVFNVETGSQVAKIEQAGELVFVDNETLAIASGTSLKKGDKLYSIVSAEVDGKLDKKAEGIVIGTHDKLSYRIKFEERNLLINVGKDNKLLYQDLKNNKHILSVIAKRNNEWIAYLPTGEYTASKNGDDKVVWSINGKNLTKENSANQYKREDVISKKLDEVAVAN